MAEDRVESQRSPIDYLSPRARRRWHLLAGFLAAGVGALFVLSLTATDVITVRGAQFSLYGIILDAVMFGGVVLCGWRAVTVRVERAPWILMTIALATWFGGNFIWHVVYHGSGPIPSWADPLWLSFYVPAYGAVAYLIRSRGLPINGLSLWVDGLIVILAAAGLASAVVYHDLAASLNGSVLSTATILAYPIGDLAVLGAVVMVLVFTGWRPERVWILLVVGLSLKTAADVVFTYQTVHERYVFGAWTDSVWVVSFVMLGFAAWQSQTSTNTAHTHSRMKSFVVTEVAAAIALVVMVLAATGQTDSGRAGGVVAGFVGVAMVLVLARGILSFIELERLGAQLAVSNSKLLEVGRLKDQVMSTVSHELRNPLTAVAGYTELLLDDVDGSLKPEDRSLLGRIDGESAHLLRILDDLQLVNALEEGDGAQVARPGFGPVDLALVARDAVTGVSVVAARQGVDVHLFTDGEVICLDGDEQRLRQVFDNLLSNAIKFSPDGGVVDLRVLRDAEEIVVTVRDHGIGIDRKDQGLLFTRFFRAANARTSGIPGTGLGLSIVKVIVAQHEGTITITSGLGDGTVITLRLPTDHAHSGVRGAPPDNHDSTRSSLKRKGAF